ncbi:MAG: hypothetical protein QM756_04820 [Polyangiaceae bacterium]
MSKPGMGLVWLGVAALLSQGCYRASTLRSHELASARFDGASANWVYRNGDTGHIDHYDELTLKLPTRTARLTPPLAGALDGQALRIQTDSGQLVFPKREVAELHIEAYSPGRPWLIAAVATGAAVLGGVIGAAGAGPCNEEWGCFGKAAGAAVGAPIGLGLGLALAIPLTRSLATRCETSAGMSCL